MGARLLAEILIWRLLHDEMMAYSGGSRHNSRRLRRYFGDRHPRTTGDGLDVMGEEERSVTNDPQGIFSRRGN